MAVTSGFFNSLNGDRKYSSEQFSALFDNLITDGVFANVGTAFEVKVSTDSSVTVGIGRAWFNSIWVYNDTLYPMAVQTTEVLLDRIDAIVIEINHNESVRTGSIRWVYGNPGSNPSRPMLTNTDQVHQYPLAYVLRKAGREKVIQADITNMIGTSSCPYVTGILSTQNIDKIVAQWESQFNTWFEGLDASLSGDVAANLANQILDLQSRFQTLAREKAVYEPLQDSNGQTIQDSDGSNILGKTAFGGENVIINYNFPQEEKEEAFKVGDILSTARTDLDDSWLLCNGAEASRKDYPELASRYPVLPDHQMSYEDINQINNSTAMGIAIGGGYQVVVGFTYYAGKWNLRALYKKDGSSWSSVDIDILAKGDYDNPIAITYANGYFVVGYQDDERYATIAYATDPSGSWTVKRLWNGLTDSTKIYRVKYLNGKFIACGYRYNNYNCAMYAYADLPSDEWTVKTAWSDSNDAFISDVIYVNGQYVFYGCGHSAHPTTAYGPTLDGNLTQKYDSGRNGTYCDRLVYGDGYYVRTYQGLSYGSFEIAYTTDLAGKWTSKSLSLNLFKRENGIDSASIDAVEMRFADYIQGYWIFGGVASNMYGELAWTKNILGEYTEWDGRVYYSSWAANGSNTYFGPYDLIFDEVGYDFVMVGNRDGNQYRIGTIPSNVFTLPSISISDDIYSYIKAKEDQ